MAQVETVRIDEHRSGSNAELVAACLDGDQAAWACLIDRYKRLIFSIPIKEGFSRDEAADIFQAVCLDLVAALARLREPEALPQWLIQTTSHKCSRYRVRRQRDVAVGAAVSELAAPSGDIPDVTLHELEQEQALRDAVHALSPRCQLMVEMLFFQTPPVPYAEVAAQLGVAPGSIGFIRARCLERLRAALKKSGL